MEKIYIFGAGKNGEKLLKLINEAAESDSYTFDIAGVCDLYKEGLEFFGNIIISPREIPKNSVVILAIADEKVMIEMYDLVFEQGIRKIYWFNGRETGNKKDKNFLVDYCVDCRWWGENVVRHVEINLADHCNLNCKCCSHFSALFEPRFPSIDELVSNIKQLKKKFSHILNFYLMGGEPLLNKDLGDIIVQVRKLLPLSRIVIVTNGLLLPGLDKSTLKLMAEKNIHVDVSEYVPTSKCINKIKNVLNEYEISYTVKSMKSDAFYKLLSISKNSKYPKGCLADGCYDVWKGQIARCPMLMYLDTFNNAFHTDLPRVGVVNLYSDVSGKELKKLLKERVPLCNHCITKKINWGQCSRNICISDFAELE